MSKEKNNDEAESIREYWNEQGNKYLASLEATSPDPLAKELELDALKNVLDKSKDTLEAGCGNGYNLFSLSNSLNGKLVGFDYSDSLIKAANRSLSANISLQKRLNFHNASIIDNIDFLGNFQQIFTDRCLINLTSLDHQILALNNLSSILDVGGSLVLIESTQQGQAALNSMRMSVGLPDIPTRWHNLFIDENKFFQNIPSDLKHIKTENFSSLYFFISRVLNAKLTPKGEDPDYMSEMNKLARLIPTFGDYSPLKLFQFEKIK